MIKFGTGGWRAIIGDDFIRSNVNILAQAIADTYNDPSQKIGDKRIVVGYDRRFLSDKAAMWVSEVFAANNIEVLFLNKDVPTPMIMFGVKSLKTPFGIAVTASHNPAEYNGIKVFTEGGRDADVSVTKKFEERIEKGVTVRKTDFDKAVKEGKIKITDISNDYLDSIIEMIDIEAIKKRHLKVLIDPMYGVSKTSLMTIFSITRCEINVINDRHDTLFGGRLPSPSALTLTKLKNMVVEEGYDIGIGTDGDADRIGIIDDKGTFIHPNEILALLYYYLVKYKGWKGDVVRNLATTHVLDKMAADFGFSCHEVPVGFKYISSKMDETNALIGGESSGGLTIRGHIKGKDGIFAASLLVEMICKTNKCISSLLDEIYGIYGKHFMAENDIRFTNEHKEYLNDLLFIKKKLPDFGLEIERVSYTDGCKVYFKNGGWVIARFSGTEPLLRVFCEMETEEQAVRTGEIMKSFCAENTV